jgi:hypothetical protein
MAADPRGIRHALEMLSVKLSGVGRFTRQRCFAKSKYQN